jgi:hypothetical protein
MGYLHETARKREEAPMEQGTQRRSLVEGGVALSAFIEAIRASTINSDATADDIVERVSAELGVPIRRVAAMITGWESVAKYGLSTTDDGNNAIQEEERALTASRQAFLPIFERRLQERIDHIEAGVSSPLCSHPDCEETMSSKGQRSRGWESTLGPINLKRRWSVCPESGHPGRSVAQEQLLLPMGRYTAKLSESMTMLATTVPHGMACQLASRLLMTEVSEHAMQNQIHDRAKTLMAADDSEAEHLNPFEENGLEREVVRPADSVPNAPDAAYLEVDGVFVMTRQLDEERSDPVPDVQGGKGRRYDLEGKEVKNAVLYTADACAEESPSRGCLIEKKYVSMLGTWTSFALLLWVTIRQLRFDQAKVLVVLSDGAKWIRELAQEWLPCSPRVLLILDLYHAIHRVYEVASAVFGDTPEGREWRQRQKQDIEEGRVEHVIGRLRFLKPVGEDAAKKVADLITYFENNQDRMDYQEYRRRGLRISSAAVESANFHVTGARMKGQGMRWEEPGAAEMARLRADLFNGTWEMRTLQALAA